MIAQKIQLHYYNPKVNVGMGTWQTVFLLSAEPVMLVPEVFRGNLIYRQKGSTRRISYQQIKRGLVKKQFFITESVPDWFVN